MRTILWLLEQMGLFCKWYLSQQSTSVSAQRLPYPGHPQDHPVSLKLMLRSLRVCEKAAFPLFLENPRKLQRRQRIKQSQGGTGAALGRPAHLPGCWPDVESGKCLPELITFPLSRTFHIFEIIPQSVAGFFLLHL